MDKNLILQNLCCYDLRNPDNVNDEDEINDHNKLVDNNFISIQCYCDNCFYGKTDLANELLRLIEILDKNNIKY
jgi:hypothetical protein